MKVLARRKQDRSLDMPMLGLSVTANGVFTGLPATIHNNEKRPISSEAEAKIEAANHAHRILETEFDWHGYEIPKDFDHFGRSEGERSYIAIVHADVNGMGKKVETIRDNFPAPSHNRSYIQAMRAFSQSMKDAAMSALQSTIDLLSNSIKSNKGKEVVGKPDNGLSVPLYREYWIPLRPIVYGGDDVTFITDGRLGLSLAAHYLRTLTRQQLKGPNAPMSIHARAGVAVVKTHFPFARAYTLTEDLIDSAKTFIKNTNEDDFTAMDWHFLTSGMLTGLKELREREYRAESGWSLLMRPVPLSPQYDDWYTWENFVAVTKDFQTGKDWKDRRNKVKALREVLRRGDKNAIEHFLRVYNIKALPSLPGIPSSDLPQEGWVDKRTPYFDAIEAMDFFIPLQEEEH
jgi:hypothetical protein